MSAQAPITETEFEALARIGLSADFGVPPRVVRQALDAYRAGFADGRTPPGPRVFRSGDPEPGGEVEVVLTADGDVWMRRGRWWTGPLVACAPLPDYDAAVEADEKRRAAAQAAGGAQ